MKNRHSVDKNISKIRHNDENFSVLKGQNEQIAQRKKKYEQTIDIFLKNLYNWYNHRNGVMGEVPPFTGFGHFKPK